MKNDKPVRMMYLGTHVINIQDSMEVIFRAAKAAGIEIYWAADFSGFHGDIKDIPCHVLQTDFRRHPLISVSNLKSILQLCKYIKEYKITFLHCNTPIGSFCGRIAGAIEKVPTVLYTAHGLPFFQGAPKWRSIFRIIEDWLSRITDYAVAMNEEDFLELNKMHFRRKKVFKIDGVGIPIRKLDTDARSVIRKKLGISEKTPIIICVGRLEKVKGVDVCIKALGKLKNKEAMLLVCGTGYEEGNLRRLVEELGLEKRVFFLGFRSDVFELLQASDIYVLSSYYEGLPRSVMEAMNAGVPCVVSNARGNVDLIKSGVNGLVVDRNDPDQVADAVGKILSDKEIGFSFAKQALYDVQKYSIENITEEYIAIYKKVISNKNVTE